MATLAKPKTTKKGETMTYLEWKDDHNVDYVLIDDEGDTYAQVSLPNIYTLDSREAIMGAMAASTYTKWSEATEYNHEG